MYAPLLCVTLLILNTPMAADETATFVVLGLHDPDSIENAARAVTDDGQVVIGSERIYRVAEPRSFDYSVGLAWSDGAYMALAPVEGAWTWGANGISAEGNVMVGGAVLGTLEVPAGALAVAWRDGVPEVLPSPMRASGFAYDGFGPAAISGDGMTIVGSANYVEGDGYVTDAIVWRGDTAERLPSLFPPASEGRSYTAAQAVSGDGRVIVGTSFNRAVRWVDGVIEQIGSDTDGLASAAGVSENGNTIVGSTTSDPRQRGFRWQNGQIDYFTGGDYPHDSCYAQAVSADGNLVIGSCNEGIVWDPANGQQFLVDVLRLDHGISLPGWWRLIPYDITPDGRTIVGEGTAPDGRTRAWLVRLPPPRTILRSDPPDGSIDARADFSSSGATPKGIDRIRLTTSSIVTNLAGDGPPDAASFSVADSSGVAPVILDVVPVDGMPYTYDVVFDEPIKPGHWTTVTIDGNRTDGLPVADHGNTVTIGFLPGDVNGSRTTNAQDITALINSLNGVTGRVFPATSTDINWSGATNAADITRLIDLLNGVNTSRAWIGQRLPS